MIWKMSRALGLATAALSLTLAANAEAQCVSDADCKSNRTCQGGACVAAPAPGACSKDMDCPGDQVCASGTCQAPAGAAAPPAPVAPPPATPPPAAPPPAMGTVPPVGAAPPPAPGQPVGYRTETRGIKGLIIAGPIVWGSVYVLGIAVTGGIAAGTGSTKTGEQMGLMAIPLAGPFVMVAAEPDRDTADYNGALVAAGVLQLAGVTMFILGLTIRSEHQVPAYGLIDGSDTADLSIGPAAIGDGAGISVRLGAPAPLGMPLEPGMSY